MKYINNIFGIISALCMMLGFNACTEEADYTPAEQLTNAQVYFSAVPSQVNLDRDATSFDVELNRMKTDDALNVSLNVTNESGLFTIPTSVSFAAGEGKAKINIGYNLEELGYANYQAITIAIADESHETPYGIAKYSFKAGIPAPYVSLGIASFNDAFLFANFYDVELQQNEVDPTMFRLVDPYTEGMNKENKELMTGNQDPYLVFSVLSPGETLFGATITMKDLVYFDPTNTGFGHPSYDNAEVKIMHPGHFKGMNIESKWTYNKVVSHQENGLPAVVQLAPLYYMDGVGGIDKSNVNNQITIIFPGVTISDYSASVVYQGCFTNVDGDNFAVANITLGKDVKNAKVAMVKGDDIDAAVTGIEDGSIAATELTESGVVNIPSSLSGLCSIVIVTYGEGKAQEAAYTSFDFSVGNASKWVSLGTATYTDDVVTGLYKVEPVTYEVEVEENSEEPGLYRLVNPYGEAYPYNEEGDWDATKKYYLVINAKDPQGVYIDLQDLGVNWGDGNMSICSMAAMYLAQGNSLEAVKASGACGSLINGVITFPTEALLAAVASVDDLFYANTNGAFKVVLPSAISSQQANKSMTTINKNFSVDKKLILKNKVPAQLKRFTMVDPNIRLK